MKKHTVELKTEPLSTDPPPHPIDALLNREENPHGGGFVTS